MNRLIAIILCLVMQMTLIGCSNEEMNYTDSGITPNAENLKPTLGAAEEPTDEVSVPSISPMDEPTTESLPTPDIWDGIEIDESFKFNYGSYDDYLSPQELADIVDLAAKMNAKPVKAVSKGLVLVHQTITTFDSESKNTFLITTSGEILREYAPIEFNGGYLHVTPFNCEFYGNYIVGNELFSEDGTLIKRLELIGGIYDSIVLDTEKYLISHVSEGYNTLYFLFPDGSSQELYFKRDTTPWPDTPMVYEEVAYLPFDYEENSMSIGYMSEGLYGVHYVRSFDHYLFYYNEKGEQIIDLSHDKTPYKVYELGRFVDGQAEIKLMGLDGKDYVAFINTSGEFVAEPQLIND